MIPSPVTTNSGIVLTCVGGDAPPNERRAVAKVNQSCSETLRAQCGENRVGRRKSGPTVYRATSDSLDFPFLGCICTK